MGRDALPGLKTDGWVHGAAHTMRGHTPPSVALPFLVGTASKKSSAPSQSVFLLLKALTLGKLTAPPEPQSPRVQNGEVAIYMHLIKPIH